MHKESNRDIKELIDHLELQVEHLIRSHQRQVYQLSQLKEERASLQAEVASLKEEIKGLNERISLSALSLSNKEYPQKVDLTWITDELTALAQDVTECIDLLDKSAGESIDSV